METEKELQQINKKSAALSIASLVCGILSLITTIWLFPIALVLGIVGIVLACIAQKKESSNGMRTAGLITSIIATVINGAFALLVLSIMTHAL